jgi:CheY-like chemotaxis protein
LVSLARFDSRSEALDQSQNNPFDASLSKPVRRSQLLDVLVQQLARPEAETGAAVPVPEASLAHQTLCILVADDSETNRRVATKMLERWGCRVETVATGREAVARAQQSPYDAILMDVQMPEMDGFRATEAIRAWGRGKGRHTPIIALTAHVHEEHRRRCLDAGMDAFLQKPIAPQELFDLLSTCSQADRRSIKPTGSASELRLVHWISTLDELCGDDVPLRIEIVRNFLDEADRGVEGLEAALVERDANRVSREAHRLKGSCLTLGVELMARVCRDIEELGKRNELAIVGTLLAQVRTELHRVREEMLRFLDERLANPARPH